VALICPGVLTELGSNDDRIWRFRSSSHQPWTYYMAVHKSDVALTHSLLTSLPPRRYNTAREIFLLHRTKLSLATFGLCSLLESIRTQLGKSNFDQDIGRLSGTPNREASTNVMLRWRPSPKTWDLRNSPQAGYSRVPAPALHTLLSASRRDYATVTFCFVETDENMYNFGIIIILQ
jgi:hypothetical protein